MAKGNVTVDEAQFSKIKKTLTTLSNDNMKKFFSTVGSRLVNDFKMGFRLGISPAGVPWKPITYREGQPLRLTRRLNNSLKSVPTNKTLEVGTNVDYAPTHQFGDNKTVTAKVPAHTKLINQAFGKALPFPVYANVKAHSKTYQRNIPARPFLGIEARQKKKIVKAFQDHIQMLTNGKAKKA